MSISAELLEFLKSQQEESRLQRLLESKGYANPQSDNFGLNPWTRRLAPQHDHGSEETVQAVIDQPDHLVSFLVISSDWHEEIIDTNSEESRRWFSEYNWQDISGLKSSFSYGRIRPYSDGILLPEWISNSAEVQLESFLLIQRNAICEFGMGRMSYSTYKEGTIFQLIQIVERFWQFLIFNKDFQERFLPENIEKTLILVNLRGTYQAFMGNLADGWKEPRFSGYDDYRPKCFDKHLQIRRQIASGLSSQNIEDNVRWFATRIENSWGQFEPRCYVHKNSDASQPFANRRSR